LKGLILSFNFLLFIVCFG